LEKLANDSNDLYQNNINDIHLRLDKSNELNQNKVNNLLEIQRFNNSNNLNKLEIKLTNDFQLKLDKSNNELNQINRIKELEKQLNDTNNSFENKMNKLEIKLTKDFQLKLDELNQNKVIESDKKQIGI